MERVAVYIFFGTHRILSGKFRVLTGLPAQHLMAILCDKYHDFPLS